MLRVLIADDNEMMRRALRNTVSRTEGWTVCGEAANGLQAVQLADKLNPDIILLDFRMPIMDGLSAAKEIKRLKPELPIAIYTLHPNTPLFEKQAKAAGIDKVISKTDIFSSLVLNLEEAVSH